MAMLDDLLAKMAAMQQRRLPVGMLASGIPLSPQGQIAQTPTPFEIPRVVGEPKQLASADYYDQPEIAYDPSRSTPLPPQSTSSLDNPNMPFQNYATIPATEPPQQNASWPQPGSPIATLLEKLRSVKYPADQTAEAAPATTQPAPSAASGFSGKPVEFGMTGAGGFGGVIQDRPTTNDPLSEEPKIFANGVPLPRSRPSDQQMSARTTPMVPQTGPTFPGSPGGMGSMGGVPFPVIGNAPLSLTPPSATDMSARSAAPQQSSDAATAESSGGIGSFFDKLLDPNKATTLLALGAGLAGAPSLGTGMSRAFGNAVPAAAAQRQFDIKQQSIAQTYRALVSKGVPPNEALAAAYNPDIMKATAQKYFEAKPPTWGIIGHDKYGQPIYGMVDVYKGTAVPGNTPRVTTPEQALKLPKGTTFVDPNGILRVR